MFRSLRAVLACLLLALAPAVVPQELHVNDSSTWREIAEVHVNDSSTWREISEIYVNDSGTWRLVFQQGEVVQPFTEWSVNDTLAGDYFAELRFNSDGTVEGATFNGGGNEVIVPGSSNWFSPTSSGVGSGYYIRFTYESGAIDQTYVTVNGVDTDGPHVGSIPSTWYQLDDDIGLKMLGSATGNSVGFTVEIATDSGGSNIVFTSTGNVLGN
jgi:hypothetical protein